jgi:hypothetical protein
MKKILFAFLLFAGQLSAQSDTTVVVFSLDTIRIDSFFLVHRDSHFSASALRPDIHQTSSFFSDTAAFSAYIASVSTEYNALISQAAALNRAKLEWNYRFERLKCLRDSVFYGLSCSGVGARMVAAPPIGFYSTRDTIDTNVFKLEIYPEKPGFWAIYSQEAKFKYVTTIEEIGTDALLLYPNGAEGRYISDLFNFEEKKRKQSKKATPKKKKQ